MLDLIRSLKDHGVAVIIISHRMDDIFYCCDRVMALFPRHKLRANRSSTAPTATRSSAGSWAPRGTRTNSRTIGSPDVTYNPKISYFLETYGIVIIVIVMMAVLTAIKPQVFPSPENLTNILKQKRIPGSARAWHAGRDHYSRNRPLGGVGDGAGDGLDRDREPGGHALAALPAAGAGDRHGGGLGQRHRPHVAQAPPPFHHDARDVEHRARAHLSCDPAARRSPACKLLCAIWA